MFINTLPVRMKVAQTGVEASVKETHAQLAELMRHEHAPLVLAAQRCSGVPAQTPLFTSLLNYRYGLRHRADAATPGGDDIELLSARERTNYPLTLSVDDLGQDAFRDGSGERTRRSAARMRVHGADAGAIGAGAGRATA
ncbi:hypothetical protein, partial [Burkholderia pseudomallei]|uniref:hypothetical protein n=1 Tax=Burkholderia pseudomallei TaxID=28450 RepID=UPI00406A4C8B